VDIKEFPRTTYAFLLAAKPGMELNHPHTALWCELDASYGPLEAALMDGSRLALSSRRAMQIYIACTVIHDRFDAYIARGTTDTSMLVSNLTAMRIERQLVGYVGLSRST
jgi:hypothetical protein